MNYQIKHGMIKKVTLSVIIFVRRYLYKDPLQGKREGQYALYIAGRKSGYRLLIVPVDADGNEWKEKDRNVVYNSTKVIIAWEVSNHYE